LEIRHARRCGTIEAVTRRVTTTAIVLVLLATSLLFTLSARNDFCLPWEQRVGYGDGALGTGEDWSACR
jgi:hypothetical protein